MVEHEAPGSSSVVVDRQGRRVNYLRLSVTDRCNLRCRYCMPAEGVPEVNHEDVLRYEELLEIARAALSLGVTKVRVTGGEPLVRKGITEFLAQVAELPGLRRLVLTTNGILLPQMAEHLRRAGVESLNVSLDSLRASTFREITRGGDLNAVRRGVDAGLRLGMQVKLNMVVMRGVNDHEIPDFVDLANQTGCVVRFIEYMPVLQSPGWQERVVAGGEILQRVAALYDLVYLEQTSSSGPAKEYRLGNGPGKIGVITPISGHFCGTCNRIRVTSTGKVRACLFSEQETDLKPYLRADHNAGLRECLREVMLGKPPGHGLSTQETSHRAFSMAAVGG